MPQMKWKKEDPSNNESLGKEMKKKEINMQSRIKILKTTDTVYVCSIEHTSIIPTQWFQEAQLQQKMMKT